MGEIKKSCTFLHIFIPGVLKREKESTTLSFPTLDLVVKNAVHSSHDVRTCSSNKMKHQFCQKAFAVKRTRFSYSIHCCPVSALSYHVLHRNLPLRRLVPFFLGRSARQSFFPSKSELIRFHYCRFRCIQIKFIYVLYGRFPNEKQVLCIYINIRTVHSKLRN